jgi:hypothetical protein
MISIAISSAFSRFYCILIVPYFFTFMLYVFRVDADCIVSVSLHDFVSIISLVVISPIAFPHDRHIFRVIISALLPLVKAIIDFTYRFTFLRSFRCWCLLSLILIWNGRQRSHLWLISFSPLPLISKLAVAASSLSRTATAPLASPRLRIPYWRFFDCSHRTLRSHLARFKMLYYSRTRIGSGVGMCFTPP